MRALLRSQRGVALPLSLFALVAVTFVITGLLFVSTTDLAVSNAQADGVRDLARANAAVESFVADQTARLAAGQTNVFRPGARVLVTLPNGDQAWLTVSKLATQLLTNPQRQRDVFAIVAEPYNQGRGGRSVGVLVDLVTPVVAGALNNLFPAAGTFGGGVTVTGNARVFSKQADTRQCTQQVEGEALHVAQDAVVDIRRTSNIQGRVVRDTLNQLALARYLLRGSTLRELAQQADIKFGPLFGAPPFPLGSKPEYNAVLPTLRWGCPASTGIYCGSPPQDTAYYPVVAIDAMGGEVIFNGNGHGQGVLIVVNGKLRVNGNFTYKGIVLAEGDVIFGGGSAQISGGLVSLGVTVVDGTLVDATGSSTLSGSLTLTYDYCAMEAARTAFNNRPQGLGPNTQVQRTYGWFEVAR